MKRGLTAAAVMVATGLAVSVPAWAASFHDPWPADARVSGEVVEIESRSPFVPADIAPDLPTTMADVTYYSPADADAARPAPAVVLLHGAGGVQHARERVYARQLAAMGVGAAVVDVFAARRDRARGFIDRVVNITETMALADAYATLAWLAARPEVDGDRVALWGFSYGAMASVFAVNAAIAGRFAEVFGLGGTRFAAHIAFYGPCITSLARPATTGAPVLMAWGSEDELIDGERCEALARDLRGGGSEVRTAVLEGALHQWDGGWNGSRRIGRQLHDCDFTVAEDLTVRSGLLGVPMTGPLSRKVMLALCVGAEGYLIGRDDSVRSESNRLVADFLGEVFGLGSSS